MAAKKGFVAVPSTLVIREEVDRGSFGVVYLATLDKKSVAVKRFHKALMTSVGPGENVPFKNFKTECERLKDLNHPNVVRYIGAYEDKKGPLLVMELLYESLEKYLNRNKGRLSPERVLEICSSVCEGMAYLHGRDKPLIHRDLGSKNVLLTKEGVVKIADFGQSKLLQNIEQPLTTTQPGTVLYMPPEAVDSKTGYTAKVDSFSLGVLLLEICTQSGPSSGLKNIGAVIEVIRHEEDLSLLGDAHPLKPLIVWCLQHEKLRPAVAVIHNHVKGVRETSKEKNEELKANQGELQDQLETNHKEELMSLREDHDRLQKENKKLEAENSKLVVSISELLITTRQCRYRLFEEQADKQQQMESLQKENKVLKADKIKLLKSLQDQLLTANHRIEELDVEKAEANRQVKLLQEKNEELKANQGELQDQLQLVNQQRDQVCAEKVQLQDQVESLQVEKAHQKSTDPSLPECDEGSGHHSLPEQCSAELKGEIGMQRHISFHSKGVEQSVKALEDKTRHLGYDVEACVSPVRPQAELVTLKEGLEKWLEEKEEEISCLKQTISELRQVQELEKHLSREGITNEIKVKAEWLKRNPQDKVYDAPDDIDESIWPFDPNLECPHCGKRFRRGQIREYRYHLDDEHAP